jgi:hypothetical protein
MHLDPDTCHVHSSGEKVGDWPASCSTHWKRRLIRGIFAASFTVLSLTVFGCVFNPHVTHELTPGCRDCPNSFLIEGASLDLVSECPFQPFFQQCDRSNPPCGAMKCPVAFHQSQTLWLASGEQIAVQWDKFFEHILTSRGVCDRDDCVPGPPPPECRNIAQGAGDVVSVLACEGFELCEKFEQVNARYHGYPAVSGCRFAGMPQQGFSPPIFTPRKSTVYQVVYAIPAGQTAQSASNPPSILAEKKIFVLEGRTTRPAIYESTTYTEATHPSYVWYKVDLTSQRDWEVNFSTKLRITKVRFLIGKKTHDPATGEFVVDVQRVARPSRLIVVSNFNDQNSIIPNQDNTSCYADISKEDGGFDLTQCVGGNIQNPGPAHLLDATPTYLKDQNRLGDRLSWFAEFNPCEGCGENCTMPCPTGATAPDLQGGVLVLAIEFTIQAL